MGSKLTLYLAVSATALALAGCEEGTGLGSSRPETAATAAADRPAATRLVERDVEAPEVFQQSEAGLWDGRPSLGGVWVAHPDVTDPERVLIRNRANGQTVIGALFRRERDGPGPRFQVSSDAATALDMLAGAPVGLDVTALRRKEAPAPAAEPASAAEPAPAEEATPSELAATEPAESGSRDPMESAAAAIDRAEAAQSAQASAAAESVDAPVAAAPVAAAPVASAPVASAPETAVDAARPSRERRGLFGGLFRRRPAEPLSAIAGASATAASAGTVVAQEISSDAPAPQPASARAFRSAANPDGAYIQVGMYSVEANAERTAALMRRNGIVPRIFEQEAGGNSFWRVAVGPATTRGERSALLRKVKGLGFDDAYAVAR